MGRAAIVPEPGEELADEGVEDAEDACDHQGEGCHGPSLRIPRRGGRPLEVVTHEDGKKLNGRQPSDVRHVVLNRHVAVSDEEQDNDCRNTEREGVGKGCTSRDVGGQEDRHSSCEDAEKRTDGDERAAVLLPLQPAAVRAGLNLLEEGLSSGSEGVGRMQRALDEALAGIAAEDDAREDAGNENRQGDGIGVAAEPRNLRNTDLDDVAEDAEDGADVDDVGASKAGQRGVDVLAVFHVSLVSGVNRRCRASGEGDMRAHERAERYVVEAEGVSGGGEDAPRCEYAEAGENEGVVASDCSTDSAARDSGEESE